MRWILVLVLAGCGPQPPFEGGSSSDDSTSTSSSGAPTSELTGGSCNFCLELESLCLAEQLYDPGICVRLRKWACKEYTDTICQTLSEHCTFAPQPCEDAAAIFAACMQLHDECELEPNMPDASSSGGDGPSGSGSAGGTSGLTDVSEGTDTSSPTSTGELPRD